MRTYLTASATALAFGLSAGIASAGTITVDIEATEYATVGDAVGGWVDFLSLDQVIAFENFESFTSYEMDADNADTAGQFGDGPLVTSVGRIAVIPPEAPGDSAVEPTDKAIVRSATQDDPMFGRFDADPGFVEGDNFLDSNDNGGLEFAFPSGQFDGMFDRIVMMVTDADDIGAAEFSVLAFGQEIENNLIVNDIVQNDANLYLLTFAFSEPVSNVGIKLRIDPGDGFGVDAIGVGVVPLPAAGWLLLGGLGGLAAMRRRKKA